MAKIAKMDKKEVNSYLNSLNEFNMIQYEINRRDTVLATAKSTITQQGNTITQLQAKLAEYERKYGNLQ